MSEIVVILPVYNGGDYLRLAVESVLNQSYTSFEFYIVDDCSTDGSWKYLSGLTDSRIKLFRNEINRGLFYNLNFLIRSTDSPIIKLWSQDDIMYPACLERVVAFHRKYPQVGFSYTGRDYIDENGELIKKNFEDSTPELVLPEMHANIAFHTGSIAGNIANVAISRRILNEVGLFREDMKICGDFDMWVRLAEHHPVGFIREPLIQLRDHKKQFSRQEVYYIYHLKEDLQVYRYLLGYVSGDMQVKGRKLLRKYKLGFYYTLMIKSFLKGKWRTTAKFWKTLASFDNMFLLTLALIKSKTGFGKREDFLENNSFLFNIK